MQRRLIIGGVATAGIAAFALIPTDSLRISRPAKALYLYLIPLLRAQASSPGSNPTALHARMLTGQGDVQELLTDVYEIVTNGRFEGMPAVHELRHVGNHHHMFATN